MSERGGARSGRLAGGTLAAAGLLLAAAEAVGGQETPAVRPGGTLDVTLSGFAKLYGVAGDVADRFGGRQSSSDLRNDTEVHFKMQGKDGSTGIVYGAVIELEADTNKNPNADETYVFLRGAFGDIQFGDDDGIAKDMAIGAHKVAVATGGLDGEGGVENEDTIYLRPSDADATKIKYRTPVLGGFRLGLGYTPSQASEGDDLARSDAGDLVDLVEAGLQWTGTLGTLGLEASLVGAAGRADSTGGTYRGTIAGAKITAFGLSIAGGAGYEDDPLRGERRFANLGAGATLGPLAVSLNYGTCYDCDPAEPEALVLGADLGLLPGLALGAEVSFFDQGRPGDRADDGVLAVTSLRLAF